MFGPDLAHIFSNKGNHAFMTSTNVIVMNMESNLKDPDDGA
jgi:hypothetical protein